MALGISSWKKLSPTFPSRRSISAHRGRCRKHRKTSSQSWIAALCRAYTPYGPVGASELGLSFIGVRARSDPGGKVMPESRAIRPQVKPEAALFDLNLDERSELLDGPHSDGRDVRREVLKANAPFSFGASSGSGGRFAIVLSGAFRTRTATYERFASLFARPGECRRDLKAGPQGLDLLSLGFPIPLSPDIAVR